jgi:PIN domain nuclease of toxin-antitoxin system
VYVADAHALGWYCTADPRLGPQAAQILARLERGKCLILVPTTVRAELFHMRRKKRIALDFADLLQDVEAKSNFTATALDMDVIKKLPDASPLTELHDQIIVITALLYEAPVLTKDGPRRHARRVETIATLTACQ